MTILSAAPWMASISGLLRCGLGALKLLLELDRFFLLLAVIPIVFSQADDALH